MKKEGLLGLVLLVFILFSLSCKKQECNYFPLSDGAKWEYSLNVRNPNMPRDPVRHGEMVFHIGGEKTINGKSYYKGAGACTIPGIEAFINYYRVGEDGIYIAMTGNERKTEFLLLPLPPTVGKTWFVEGSEGGKAVNIEYRIDGKETLQALDKTYGDCIKVSSKHTMIEKPDETLMEVVYYYAPNIGWVKTVITMQDTIITSVLKSYEP